VLSNEEFNEICFFLLVRVDLLFQVILDEVEIEQQVQKRFNIIED
jgi:hypothetical protein